MIFQDKASALNIIGIYSTNAFKMGVGIQTARFNHSCCSNAEAIWDDEDKTRNTRAVSKITAGEEININYHWEGLSMIASLIPHNQSHLTKHQISIDFL